MFCPECRVEYRPGFTQCADCHVPLIDVLDDDDEFFEERAEAIGRARADRRMSRIVVLSGFGGIALAAVVSSFLATSSLGIALMVLMFVGSYITIVVGAGFYARSKGYGLGYGALVLLGIIGLLVLTNLKDKIREEWG